MQDFKRAPTFRAIVAFNDSNAVSDDWNWFFDDLKETCEGRGISVLHADPVRKHVHVGSDDTQSTRIDLTEFFRYHKGYVFLEHGREPVFQPYDQSHEVLARASEYFGMALST